MENRGVPVILSTERLLFRRHVMTDMEAYCEMEQDPDIRKFIGGYPRPREDAEKRFFKALEQPAGEKLSMWATILKAEDRYIGRCGVYPHFDNAGQIIECEGTLAFYIAKAYWGNGFATEAGRAFIDLGFNELGLKRLVTTIQAGNDASLRVVEKLGFSKTFTEPATQTNARSFIHFELINPIITHTQYPSPV